MTIKQKKSLARILVSMLAMALCMLLPLEGWAKFTAFLAVYLLIGWDILYSALRRIIRGQFFDENFLMSVATIGAFALGEYAEGVFVMLFYQIGEWFQNYAVARSRKSITELMDIKPDEAHRKLADGTLQTVSPEDIAVGELVVVKPGERVPLDGTVIEGTSSLDTSALTGESLPKLVGENEEILSGCINLNGLLTVKVEKPFGDSTVARILKLVQTASNKKAKAENFITKFSKYYTPIVCALALLLALVPPLFNNYDFATWVHRALTFLVISCPCALVISVPLSFFGGIGGASRCGILVKGGASLEVVSKAKTVVFDKTGTLTQGNFSVSEVAAQGISEKDLLEIAAYAEYYSNHPIGQSILKAYDGEILVDKISNYEDVAGYGIRTDIDNKNVIAGKPEWLREEGIECPEINKTGTIICVAVDRVYVGYILIQDMLKTDAKKAIANLKALGVRTTALFTGDSKATGEYVAQLVGVDIAYTRMLPADKVTKLEEIIDKRPIGENVAFVGDGINDAPVIALADVGIAMGGIGSDAAIEAADIVIMTDEPSKVATAVKIGKKTMRIVTQNIVFAIGVKVIVLLLGALGLASMWAAVFADVGVSVIAILNAMRALNVKDIDN